MVGDFEIEQIAHHAFYLLDARIAKFEYAATVYTNQVVVLLKTIGLFVLSKVFSELVFFDEVAIDE